MAVPKKRRSKSKKRIKRACWKIETPQLRACPSCGAMGIPHLVCAVCGKYKGRQVVNIKIKKDVQQEEIKES